MNFPHPRKSPNSTATNLKGKNVFLHRNVKTDDPLTINLIFLVIINQNFLYIISFVQQLFAM